MGFYVHDHHKETANAGGWSGVATADTITQQSALEAWLKSRAALARFEEISLNSSARDCAEICAETGSELMRFSVSII
ncbi:MAG: hypothetical protein PF483_12090 [Halothiobacillus sp.]|nr:hypothetical protein [Halothiobacillus sp.]